MPKRARRPKKTSGARSTARDPSKALAAEWRKKLAASGFVDIEKPNGELGAPPAPGVIRREKQLPPETYVDKADYYVKAGRFLSSHAFANKEERELWRLHAEEGLSYRDIANLSGTYPRLVYDTIARLRALMMGSGGGGSGGQGGSGLMQRISRKLKRMDWATLLQIAPMFNKRGK